MGHPCLTPKARLLHVPSVAVNECDRCKNAGDDGATAHGGGGGMVLTSVPSSSTLPLLPLIWVSEPYPPCLPEDSMSRLTSFLIDSFSP